MTLVSEESAKSKAAKEVIKSLTAQVILIVLVLLCLPSYTVAAVSYSLQINIIAINISMNFLHANGILVLVWFYQLHSTRRHIFPIATTAMALCHQITHSKNMYIYLIQEKFVYFVPSLSKYWYEQSANFLWLFDRYFFLWWLLHVFSAVACLAQGYGWETTTRSGSLWW